MKNNFLYHLVLMLILLSSINLESQSLSLFSPNEELKISVEISDRIIWSVNLKGNDVITNSQVSMVTDHGRDLGIAPSLLNNTVKAHEEEIKPQVSNKDAVIISKYNELILEFAGDYRLAFRAYDDGVSYRFEDDNNDNKNIIEEQMSLSFPEHTITYFPQEESMYSHNERTYLNKQVNTMSDGDFCSLPVLFKVGNANVLFTEASLHDYPGMFLTYKGENSFVAMHPPYVIKAIPNDKFYPDRNQILQEQADYIAQIKGKRIFPWRVFVISDDDKALVESNLVTQLSGASKIPDADWIKPGKVAWDWYNANNIYGVDFESGINTETYKYYIDFASENGIEYVILDEGWTRSTTEILDYNDDIDVPGLIEYGKSKNVEIILWVLWKPLNENMDEILKLYSSWGAVGIKVDFMQRNDQGMVRSYEEIAALAAEYKLMVDYHGAFKPSGIERVWPNIVSYEGVKGNEHNKWSGDINPEHNVTIPFIRMVAGPMDFTPGSMVNAQKANYAIRFTRPMGMGTRSHQLAMYVVYESPIQMMCESPTIYKREKESVDFITRIPTTWDETIVLEASVADYIVVARRKGKSWYIGAMTDWSPRQFNIDLSFLSEGPYTMEIMKDGKNASKNAEDYKKESIGVTNDDNILIEMAPGGGWVAIITGS